MQFNNFLNFVLTILFGFMSLGLALPTGEDTSTVEARGKFGYDWMLVCPAANSNVLARECWRRYGTTCDGDGQIQNAFHGGPRDRPICNIRVCTCLRRPGVALPGFAEPANLGAGSLSGYHGWGLVNNPGAPVVGKIPQASSGITSTASPTATAAARSVEDVEVESRHFEDDENEIEGLSST